MGALGIGYAAWTDTIAINGTVNTGSLDLSLGTLSSTYVYKNLQYHTMVISPTPITGLFYVASSVASLPVQPTSGHAVNMVWDNVFPDVAFECDMEFKVVGTIPVRIHLDKVYTLDFVNAPHLVDYYLTYAVTLNGVPYLGDPEGLQLHASDIVHLIVTLKIPEEASLMNQKAAGTLTITAVQWNAYTP